jgi:hypothetical protein
MMHFRPQAIGSALLIVGEGEVDQQDNGAFASEPGSCASHGAASVSTLSGFDPSRVVSDSEDYLHTFYGILAYGRFWTPMPFASAEEARARLERYSLHTSENHEVVPVRVQLTAIAMETREGGDAKQDPSRSDNSAAIAQTPSEGSVK